MVTKVILADDQDSMLSASKQAVEQIAADHPGITVCGTAPNGKELVQLAGRTPGVELALIDIRMPGLDGLSALVMAKAKYPNLKVVMVSSESERSMSSKAGAEKESDQKKQIAMLDKLAQRLKTGQPPEPGKINSMLEGCEKLGADPIKIAEHYGASGYITKPINPKKLSKLVSQLSSGKFVHVGLF